MKGGVLEITFKLEVVRYKVFLKSYIYLIFVILVFLRMTFHCTDFRNHLSRKPKYTNQSIKLRYIHVLNISSERFHSFLKCMCTYVIL